MTAALTIAEEEPQHMRALRRANEVTTARAALKRNIRDGHITAAEVVLAPPPEALRMTVADLLRSQKRWGTDRVSGVLGRVGVSEMRAVGALTERQRGVLAAALDPRTVHERAADERAAELDDVYVALVEHAEGGIRARDLAGILNWDAKPMGEALKVLQGQGRASHGDEKRRRWRAVSARS